MTRVAAVDCGTNSVRLLVADVVAGALVDVHRELRVVRLGQGVDATGVLHPDALARTFAALRDYAATIAATGAERVRMVATSATRDAANRAEFVAGCAEVLGVEPEVVSGAEEAALSFRGATAGVALPGPYLVADIGGGSTEVVLGTRDVAAARSVDVGCVRLTERCLRSDPPTPAEVAEARATVRAALDAVDAAVPVAEARTFLGLAGSVTTVAALALGVPLDRVHGRYVDAAAVAAVTEALLATPRAERAALPAMHPGRVDVIGGGALVLDEILRRWSLPGVVPSDRDILDGIALRLAGPVQPSGSAERSVSG